MPSETLSLIERSDALARGLYDAKKFKEASASAEITLALSGRSYPALLNAARCYVYAGQPVRAEVFLREAQEHKERPLGDHSARELLSLALSWQGRYDDAEHITLALPDSPHRAFNLGWHKLRRGEFKDAFPLLERGRMTGVWGDRDFALPIPMWSGTEDLTGKTVLLNLERGLGDHIIQVRHARDLAERGAFVIVRTHPSLTMVLSQADGVGQTTTGEPASDFWLSGMYAPIALSLEKPDHRPYLKPTPWLIEKWQTRLGDKHPRIALRWQGNPQFEYEQMRTIPVGLLADTLRPIAGEGGVIFSVQRDEGMEKCPQGIDSLGPELVTWEDTITALSLMDVVVTSCTSVAHAAAALGVPTVVITPILPYYPWSDETAMPKSTWYQNTLVARQKKVGEWDEPIAEASEYVSRLLAERHCEERGSASDVAIQSEKTMDCRVASSTSLLSPRNDDRTALS